MESELELELEYFFASVLFEFVMVTVRERGIELSIFVSIYHYMYRSIYLCIDLCIDLSIYPSIERRMYVCMYIRYIINIVHLANVPLQLSKIPCLSVV